MRVLASSKIDLGEAARGGAFREDLYYRLNVVPITLPPLRERADDIAALARHFLVQAAGEGLPRHTLGDDAAALLTAQTWRGNVRELRNFIYRLALMAREDVIDASAVMPLLDSPRGDDQRVASSIDDAVDTWLASSDTGAGAIYDAALAAFERPLFVAVLRRTGGNQLRAAQELGINRNTLRKRLQELDIDPLQIGRSQ